MKTHYDVLGVSRNASVETIRAAFRKAAKKYHPDLNGGDTRCEAQLRQVLAAYEMLKKPGHRAAYDCFLRHRRRERFRTLTMTVGAGLGSGSIMVVLMLALMSPQVASGTHPAPHLVVATVNPSAGPQASPQHASLQQARLHQAAVDRDGQGSNVARKSDRVATAAGPQARDPITRDPITRDPITRDPITRDPQARDNQSTPVRQAAAEAPAAAVRDRLRTRLTREWQQVQASGDPKAILGFAARNRDASDGELARSKLIAVIDTAEDVALLNVLGLGDGAIAERAKQRLDRLRATATAKQSRATLHDTVSLEERAARFVTARVATWASINADSLATFASAYADKVHYQGSRKSRKVIVLEKRLFLARWPERAYDVRPGSVTVQCAGIVCKVAGMVDWQIRNAARTKSASGVARFEYEVAVSGSGFRILSESSSDLKRPRQAASCPKPPASVTAASEPRQQATRCLQMARTTRSAKRKAVLLARAQAWTQRAEAREQIELRFADRWPQEAALRRMTQ